LQCCRSAIGDNRLVQSVEFFECIGQIVACLREIRCDFQGPLKTQERLGSFADREKCVAEVVKCLRRFRMKLDGLAIKSNCLRRSIALVQQIAKRVTCRRGFRLKLQKRKQIRSSVGIVRPKDNRAFEATDRVGNRPGCMQRDTQIVQILR